MERTISATDSPTKIRWKNKGGGSFRMPGKIIKPGQVFDAFETEIPLSFRDQIIPIDGTVVLKQGVVKPVEVKVTSPLYTILPKNNSKTWFNVVDAQGKVLNEKGLTKEVAEKLVADLLK